MKLHATGDLVVTSAGEIRFPRRVQEAFEINEAVVVLYDYMAFDPGLPARNLYAYSKTGVELWRAEDIGAGTADAYTNIVSESPLIVGNFAGYDCTIDVATGKVVQTKFTK